MNKNGVGLILLGLIGFSIAIFVVACGGGTTEAPAPVSEPTEEATVEEPAAEVTGDATRGGLLYDKWWAVLESDAPTEDQPLWATQTTNTRSGVDTWRCKECHGWDYQGADGAYGSGSHATGFPGVFGAEMTAEEFVAALTSDDHDFSAVMAEQDINDLAVFMAEALVDDHEYIDYESRAALGDATNGEALYTESCASCHGEDGWLIPFDDGEAGVGTLANDNPWEVLHKIRFGQPGSPAMPSAETLGWSTQDAVDVLTYAQTLSVELPVSEAAVRGGLLYDRWWAVVEGAEAPTEDMPLWATQTTNTRSGADTWRCKECHGWDYLGAEGAYASGSHLTGFPGVFGTEMTLEEYVAVLTGGANSDHDFSAAMGEDDIAALAAFLSEGLIDERDYIDYESGAALGDATNGEALYTDTCAACHGEDGWLIPFDDGAAGVGTLAVDNPWEVLHKIRFGQPGSPMPSAEASGWSIQDVVDVLTYIQTLPVAAP